MNNDCNSAPCYGPFRTSFDRMMQSKFSPFCQPSSQLVCNAAGNTVLDAKGSMVEAYRANQAHMARARAMQARRMQARRMQARAMHARRARAARSKKSVEGFEEDKRKKANGKGKKTAKVGLANWCGFCKKLKREIPKVKKMLDEAGIELEMIEDEADLKKLMEENDQNGFPFAVLVDESGLVVDSFGGFMPAEAYSARVKKAYK